MYTRQSPDTYPSHACVCLKDLEVAWPSAIICVYSNMNHPILSKVAPFEAQALQYKQNNESFSYRYHLCQA